MLQEHQQRLAEWQAKRERAKKALEQLQGYSGLRIGLRAFVGTDGCKQMLVGTQRGLLTHCSDKARLQACSRCVMNNLLLMCVSLCIHSFAQQDVAGAASRLELEGQFKQAAALLTHGVAGQSAARRERKKLEFELDRLDRIKQDFPLTKEALFAELKGSVKNLTAEEYERWLKEGRFESRDDRRHAFFMGDERQESLHALPGIERAAHASEGHHLLEKARLESVRAIKQAAAGREDTLRAAKALSRDHERDGQGRCRTGRRNRSAPGFPFPGNIHSKMTFETDPPPRPSSTWTTRRVPFARAYLEQPARRLATDAVQGRIRIHRPRRLRSTSSRRRSGACDRNDSALKAFTCEGPHVVFTPELRALSQQIVGDETNPCLKAKKCFDWIAENIKYSYAIEYSTIRNISEYCRAKGYGDCGQEACSLSALCRLNGIPARWQSGWNTFPGDKSNHDWSEIYLAPYGWMPVDPYMGIWAMRYADHPEAGAEAARFETSISAAWTNTA